MISDITYDVIKILDTLTVDHHSAGANNVKIKCINPDHPDKDPSLYIHKETGWLHCFSCGYSRPIQTLVHYYTQFTEIEVAKFLMQFVLQNKSSSRIVPVLNRESQESDFTTPRHRIIDSHWYLEKRGFTKNEIVEWEMGVVNDPNPKFMRYNGWVYIPIKQNHEVKNYFMRNPNDKQKLYGPYPIKNLLAGIDSCDSDKPVYVLEGIFKMIAMRRAGVQAVACLSNRVTQEQLHKLKKFKKVVAVPDNDTAGLKMVETLKPLIYSSDVSVCQLPADKKDADECSIEELISSINNEKSIQEFIINFLKTY